MMWIVTMALSGAGLGLYQALATVPRIRALPTIGGAVVLVFLVVWPSFQLSPDVTPWWLSTVASFTFLLTFIAASSLYSASLWLERFPEAELTYREMLSRELVNPKYLRQQYAAMLVDREKQRAFWNSDSGTTSDAVD
ncbi:hypothetical protein [Salinibacterium sp. PAMC 21357]|uniref:hypothetical protein n=1 Tax=Salinibacterium sp. PAMC 21357 TaxID=1112215 RepID=UPI0002893D55|nr:hypothetical protein [Salinibacterium sp. PAMC 21357]